jgi:hypothetical protein
LFHFQLAEDEELAEMPEFANVASTVLAASQEFMRQQKVRE